MYFLSIKGSDLKNQNTNQFFTSQGTVVVSRNLDKMMKLVLLAVLVAVVNGEGFGFGHGGYGGYGAGPYYLGYGFVAGGHGYHRPGIAKVQVQQNPYSYHYNVNEHGPGYKKYINQGASFHHGGYGGY